MVIMKRIAILADIHANVPALTAVIRDIDQQHIDEVLVGGDLVGRGPQGTAIVEVIASKGWDCIRGNHEDYTLNFARGHVPEEWLDSEEWSAARWMGAELSEQAIAFIDALPLTCTSSLCPDIRLVHGSPASYREGIGSWTDEETLQHHLSEVEESILICGHTHRPFEARLEDGWIVNVGSVGMPFNGDWRAQYAILSSEDDTHWSVEFRQIEYDREAQLEIYKSSGFLEAGGMTSQLLYIELQRARPYLVPFLRWCELESHTPCLQRIDDFLSIYDETQPMALFQGAEPKD